MNISMFSRSSQVLENEIDDGILVARGDRGDEPVVVLDGQLPSLLHVVSARPEECVADPGVIDQETVEVGLEVYVSGHFAHDLVEPVVLQDPSRGASSVLLPLEAAPAYPSTPRAALGFEVLHGQPADGGVDHRRDKESLSASSGS